ncbi:hypothetical protein TNCV_3817201 [Trichonephila clavipes]|nr:hypothetical protein TNCV_3817201 [Trichonephila clavipes]
MRFQNPVDTAYDTFYGVSGKRLSGRRLLTPTSVSRLLMVSLDGTGCLEGGKVALNRTSDVVGEVYSFYDRDHLCSWDVLTLRDGTLYLL